MMSKFAKIGWFGWQVLEGSFFGVVSGWTWLNLQPRFLFGESREG
ncbi:MAG: hypothetical protein ABIH36_02915 [bacterium]